MQELAEPIPSRPSLGLSRLLAGLRSSPPTGDLDSLWPAVLEAVRDQHKLLRAFFSEATP